MREYHSHFEHSGDDWLLYRGQGLGTLAQLCDVLWRLTTATVVGLNFVAQRIPLGGEDAATQMAVEIRQDNVAALQAQIQAQQGLAVELPPEVQQQLAAAMGAQPPG